MDIDYIPLNHSVPSNSIIQNQTSEVSKISTSKGSLKHKLFKLAILALVLIFLGLIIGFIRVEIIKNANSFNDSGEQVFKVIEDSAYSYINLFDPQLGKIETCSSNSFYRMNYMKSRTCMINMVDNQSFLGVLGEVLENPRSTITVDPQAINTGTVEMKEADMALSALKIKEIVLIRSKGMNQIKPYVPLYNGSLLGAFISTYEGDSQKVCEIYLEDRIIIMLSDIEVDLEIDFISKFNKDNLVESYVDTKGGFINNYEYKSEKDIESELDVHLENYLAERALPLLLPKRNDPATPSIPRNDQPVKVKLSKLSVLYIPAFFSTSIIGKKGEEPIKTLTLTFNNRSRVLSTLMQIIYNNSD